MVCIRNYDSDYPDFCANTQSSVSAVHIYRVKEGNFPTATIMRCSWVTTGTRDGMVYGNIFRLVLPLDVPLNVQSSFSFLPPFPSAPPLKPMTKRHRFVSLYFGGSYGLIWSPAFDKRRSSNNVGDTRAVPPLPTTNSFVTPPRPPTHLP